MKADYQQDPTLYHRCLTLIDACFPGIKKISDEGKKNHVHWDQGSIPFVIEHQGEILAHLGVATYHLIIEHKPFLAAAIHGVCVREDHRGKGLFKQLMQEALAFTEERFDFSFLFTDHDELYKTYKFLKQLESDYLITTISKPATRTDLKIFPWTKIENVTKLQNCLKTRLPISQRFGITTETIFYALGALRGPMYYCDKSNILLMYEMDHDCLILKDVISQKPWTLEEVVALIPQSFTKIVLQFCPDQLFKGDYTLQPAQSECFIMTSKECKIGAAPFRFPEPYRC